MIKITHLKNRQNTQDIIKQINWFSCIKLYIEIITKNINIVNGPAVNILIELILWTDNKT